MPSSDQIIICRRRQLSALLDCAKYGRLLNPQTLYPSVSFLIMSNNKCQVGCVVFSPIECCWCFKVRIHVSRKSNSKKSPNVLNNFLLTMLTQRPAEMLTSTALMMDMCPKLDRSHRTACFCKCFTYVAKTIANSTTYSRKRGITMAPLFLSLTS